MIAPQRGLVLSALLALLLSPGVAFAQSEDERARARSLFEQGIESAHSGDHAAAVEAFAESYALFPHPGTLMNLGLYQDGQGLLVEAHLSFTELLNRFGSVLSDEARERARERLRHLEERLSLVEVEVTSDGAQVSVDGDAVGTTPLERPLVLVPGTHELEARLTGYEPARRVLDLTPGQRAAVVVELSLSAGAIREQPGVDEDPSSRSDEDEEPRRERRSFWRGPWPWVIGGLILSASAAGLTVGLWPDDDLDTDWEGTFR